MKNKIIKYVKPEKGYTMIPKYFIDDHEVTVYQYYDLDEYLNSDVDALQDLLEGYQKDFGYTGGLFYKNRISLIRKLIRIAKWASIDRQSDQSVMQENDGPYFGIDEDGFPNIFF
tara:strand:- start:3761 stop:4105 length:345 start_codon:yes stop_codon:yes gene_type:complete